MPAKRVTRQRSSPEVRNIESKESKVSQRQTTVNKEVESIRPQRRVTDTKAPERQIPKRRSQRHRDSEVDIPEIEVADTNVTPLQAHSKGSIQKEDIAQQAKPSPKEKNAQQQNAPETTRAEPAKERKETRQRSPLETPFYHERTIHKTYNRTRCRGRSSCTDI